MTYSDLPPSTPENDFLDRDLLDRIVERLRDARAVQLIGHVRPDGDCIGSLLAMHHLLDGWGVPNAIAVHKNSQQGYAELADYDRIGDRPDDSLNPQLVVYLDCASQERGFEDWTPPAPIVNIDHHVGNTRYGEINWIEPRCAATGEMLYRLARHAGATLTRPIAEALFVALSTDTGSFRFSNTGHAQLRIAADLVAAGADPRRIAKIAYGGQRVESIRLLGHIMSTLHMECEDALAWSEVRQATYKSMGGEDVLPENAANALCTIQGVQVAALFHEMADGNMRINLRSNGPLDVQKLASRWGGGGHPAAAGLTHPIKDYEKDRDEILCVIRSEIAAHRT